MRIFKFGGASTQDVKNIKNIVSIIKNEPNKALVLVISAMGKMTNAFEKIVDAHLSNAKDLESSLNDVINFHQNIIDELFDDNHPVYEQFSELIHQLKAFLDSNKKTDYDFVYDQVVCFGELISSTIISHYLQVCGVENEWKDVRKLVVTDNNYRNAKVDWLNTEKEIIKAVDASKITIVQGFLGGCNKNTTTLGREGSDYTAGIFAYCLQAKNVTIWKDVLGVLNADPRVFEEVTLINKISYEEAIEMAFYGASVIHPKTIQPLQHKKIPLLVKSFLHPKQAGTTVSEGVLIQPKIPCYIVKKDQILISIASKDFSFIVEENISEIFKLLHHHNLKVNLIQNSAISFSLCIDNKFNHFAEFYETISKKFRVSYHKNVDLFTIRHFNDKSLHDIKALGNSLLTQISKETAQVVLQKSN